MNPPQVYTCSPSWTLLPPPAPYHPSGSSQCTSPKHPVSCIESGLATRFIHDILHVSMPFSQIFPPSPSPTESIRLFYTSGMCKLFLSYVEQLPYYEGFEDYLMWGKLQCYLILYLWLCYFREGSVCMFYCDCCLIKFLLLKIENIMWKWSYIFLILPLSPLHILFKLKKDFDPTLTEQIQVNYFLGY